LPARNAGRQHGIGLADEISRALVARGAGNPHRHVLAAELLAEFQCQGPFAVGLERFSERPDEQRLLVAAALLPEQPRRSGQPIAVEQDTLAFGDRGSNGRWGGHRAAQSLERQLAVK
jgi:hypothetical protein